MPSIVRRSQAYGLMVQLRERTNDKPAMRTSLQRNSSTRCGYIVSVPIPAGNERINGLPWAFAKAEASSMFSRIRASSKSPLACHM